MLKKEMKKVIDELKQELLEIDDMVLDLQDESKLKDLSMGFVVEMLDAFIFGSITDQHLVMKSVRDALLRAMHPNIREKYRVNKGGYYE